MRDNPYIGIGGIVVIRYILDVAPGQEDGCEAMMMMMVMVMVMTMTMMMMMIYGHNRHWTSACQPEAQPMQAYHLALVESPPKRGISAQGHMPGWILRPIPGVVLDKGQRLAMLFARLTTLESWQPRLLPAVSQKMGVKTIPTPGAS